MAKRDSQPAPTLLPFGGDLLDPDSGLRHSPSAEEEWVRRHTQGGGQDQAGNGETSVSRLLIVAPMFLMLCGASFAGSTPVDLPEKLKCQLHSEGFCYDNDECNDIDIRHISGHSETREIKINLKKENVVINNYGYGEIRHMTNIDFRNRGDLVSSWDLRDPEGSIWRDYLLRVPTGFRLETHFLANITPGKRDPTPVDGNFVIYDCFLRSETKAHRAQK